MSKGLQTVIGVGFLSLCLVSAQGVVRSQGVPGPGTALPTISASDVIVNEGQAGATAATVTVSLSTASAQPVTVAYTVVDGTATGADYVTASGSVTFAPGEATWAITVLIIGDTLDEDDEQFTVLLSAPTNATLGDVEAIVTIEDDDGPIRRYLAEGATSAFFDTRIALLNPSPTFAANVTLRFLRSDGVTVSHGLTAPQLGRVTVDARAVPGLEAAEFSTVVESDQPVVADRTIQWDAQGYGSQAETSVGAPSRTWYLAEGATHSGFELFYLIQNPNAAATAVTITYLLPAPGAPVVRTYGVAPASRSTIWVDMEADLGNTDVSAVITADLPVVVERAMYLGTQGLYFGAGHGSAGATTAATRWFLAEGATGPYFDLFIPIANPTTATAEVTATYLLPSGATVVKGYTVAPQSRFNVWVDIEDPQLANTGVSSIVTSTNGVPIVVERVMWWPGDSTTWTEGHSSHGSTATGTRWGLADGELGGPNAVETYLLIVNTSPTGGAATVTLYFEDGGSAESRTYPLAPSSRLDVPIAVDFPAAANRRFSAIVESTGSPLAEIVVERAMYSNALGVAWAAGTSTLGTLLRPPPSPPPVIDESLQLLTIDTDQVARVRASLRRGEPTYVAALAALVRQADRALTIAPFSVMDKEIVPPSRDKHDYMSQAPYWWPDPSESDGLPYIRRDGQRNPEIDRITDRANLGRLASLVHTLALAFHLTGQESYAQHAAQLVRTWFLDPATRMNPHLSFAQGIPGIANGRAAGIIESRLLPSVLDGVLFLRGSPAWSAADDQALHEWVRAFLTWLLTSPAGQSAASGGNNQTTWYLVQVAALAVYTGQTDAALSALDLAREEIGRQFRPDGRQPRELERTRSWDYSIFNLIAFQHLAAIGDYVGVDLWNYSTADGRSLRKGLEYLIPFATGEKRYPHQQIGGFDGAALHPALRRAAVGWNEPSYRELAQQIGGGTRRLELTFGDAGFGPEVP